MILKMITGFNIYSLPWLLTIAPTTYFLIGLVFFFAVAITLAVATKFLEGTMGVFSFKWSIFLVVSGLAMLASDLLHIFLFK